MGSRAKLDEFIEEWCIRWGEIEATEDSEGSPTTTFAEGGVYALLLAFKTIHGHSWGSRMRVRKFRLMGREEGIHSLLTFCHSNIRTKRQSIARWRGQHTKAEWAGMLKAFKNRCAACGSEGELTKDHIVPISLGGSDAITNLQPLCLSCNASKSDSALGADWLAGPRKKRGRKPKVSG